MIHIEYIADETGCTGIAGLWEVPTDFDATEIYATFCAGFVAAHPTKSGRLTARQRHTQARQWLKHLDGLFKRVPHSQRA